MITKQLPLTCGRTVTLMAPDITLLLASDVDIPNAALNQILDLTVYGVSLTVPTGDDARGEENKQFLQTQFEVAALCMDEPKFILRGPVPEGAVTNADLRLRAADLNNITAFFLNGGSDGVSAPPDNEPVQDTPADSAGATLEPDASGDATP